VATKPVVEIDVDDEAFRRFTELFNDYSAKLDEQPEAWRKLNEAMGGGGDALREGAMGAKEALALAGAQAILIVEELKNATKGQHEFSRATGHSHKQMKGLAESAKGLGSTIFGIGKWLTGFGVTALGLGALASGFGFGALSNAALSRQRSANQLGLNPGALSSFQVNAQQFLDVGALRSAVETQADITKSGALANLGIDFRRAQGMTPSDLAFEELIKARTAYLQDQRARLSPMQDPRIQSYLAVGGQYGDVLNAAMEPNLARIRAAQGDTRRGAPGYGFDRETAAEWITLKKALDSAGVTIETGLIKALAPLAPQIATLSKEVVGFIAAFLDSKEFGVVVDDVKQGLKALGNFVVTTDWKAIGTDIGLVASEIGAVAHRLRWLLPHDASDEKKAVDDYFRDHPDEKKKNDATEAHARATWDSIKGVGSWMSRIGGWVTNPALEASKWLAGRDAGNAQASAMWSAAKQFGVDPRLVAAEYRTEGGAGAVKPFGLLAGTRGYGGTGYRGKDESFAEYAKVNAASWASDMREMRAKHIPITMESLIRYHEAWFTPVGASNDPHGLNANKIRNMMADVSGSTPAVQDTARHDTALHRSVIKALKNRQPVKPAHVSITNATSARVAVSAYSAVF
jgi:hypothetical protein